MAYAKMETKVNHVFIKNFNNLGLFFIIINQFLDSVHTCWAIPRPFITSIITMLPSITQIISIHALSITIASEFPVMTVA